VVLGVVEKATQVDPSPLRILILGGLVPWYPTVGGTSTVPFQLAEALAKAGHHVDYLAVAPGNSRRETEHSRAQYLSVGPGSLAFPNSLAFPLYQYLKTLGSLMNYDIVHCEARDAAFYAVHRAIFGAPPRLVAAEYTPAIPRFFWQRRSLFEPYLYLALKLADLVICPCDYTSVNVSQAYGIPLLKTRPLHGGVHASFLARSPRRVPREGFNLLFCGRLNGRRPHKTVDTLLKAMPRVLQRHAAELNIIGTGPRLDECTTLARTLGVQSAVHFLGFIDPRELPVHYGRADLFVLASVRESFPLVLLEAMASGLPVVATAVGGIPEMVVDGETGLLVPANNSQALAHAINSLLDEPARMKAMGARGKERVRKHFTWDKVAQRMVGYFREIS
jgi:glycosyltransferase involved in cell wall biosynthesis